MAAFPVAKLAALLLKQLSKPIANYAKERAKTHPFFRRHVCMPPAQFYNWCEVKMKMWVMNMGKPVDIPQLNEAMAIELGANLLGETIIFSIAAVVLFLEYARQVRKETKKEEGRQREITELSEALQNVTFTVEKQGVELKELRRKMVDLETKVDIALHRPFRPKTPPSDGGTIKNGLRHETQHTEHQHFAGKPYELKYNGTVLKALDYLTFQIPNGYYR
ncbi:putative OPA3-like protein CG13603 isoform X2 [Cimex lectularius]|uniref:OPA3-like protein CG13603 n=1 Tax=Cimex lectularius TaxID=79782 RepID=A0A8I6RUM5_CIMLE|nr:putative OPA3-like protein CG13603 isoform X2 [Cimex lectularius]